MQSKKMIVEPLAFNKQHLKFFSLLRIQPLLNNLALIDFAKKTRDSHREKSMKLKPEYMWQTIISQIDQQLYEVFSELVNIIDQKLTKRPQSLLS